MKSNKKRIVQANLNNNGGAFSVAYEVQQKLQDDFVFDYFCADKFVKNNVYNHLISMGSKCIGDIECKSRFFKQYEIYKAFKNFLTKNKYEFVHIHADTAWKMSVYYLAAKKAGVQNIVVHSHSSGINGHYKKLNYLLHLLFKTVIKNAKYRCACSDVAAKWMFNTTENVTVIRNGVDIEKYKYNKCTREEIRRKLGIKNEIVIGNVSDFSPPKNPEFIFEIIKAFKNNPKYIFLMVGNRDTCLLKDYVDKDGTIQNVIFGGMVTNVQDYLGAMDIFVLPSRFEGLPMCALEAQVSGLYTMISDKITLETKCSEYFSQLPLDIDVWKKNIEDIDLRSYHRESMSDYLDVKKASASNMAEEFRRIYTKGK